MTEEANQLIVLGNGFDLHCGLKSSYKDFLYYVITQIYHFSIDSDDRNQAINQAFDKFLKSLKDVLERFRVDNNFVSYTESMNEFLSDINIWYLILFNEHLAQSSNWSDIESVIEKYVSIKFINSDGKDKSAKSFISVLVDVFFNYGFKKNLLSDRQLKTEEYIFAGLLLYHIFKRNINDYGIKKEADRLFKSYREKSAFSNRNNRIAIKVKIEEFSGVTEFIINLLMSELHNLEKDFQAYLIQEIENEEYKSKAKNFLQTIVRDGGYPLSYSVFSFNYTNSCSGNLGTQVAFRNVHGALNQNSNESKIIFGIDNISSDSKSEDISYRFTKSYRTMRLYTELENDKTFGDKIDNIFTKDMDVIKFYGHSLARADYSYFQYIFDMYDLYNSNIKLIFYYSKIEGRTVEEVRQEQYRNITKLIEQYGETLDNKAHGRNLLTRLIQTGRLKIKEIGD